MARRTRFQPYTRCAALLASTALALPASALAATKDLEEVVVTAAPYVISLDSTTTSVNVIKREELDRAPPAGLGDVLAQVPGVRSSAFGPGASRPVIRGLSGPRVMVLTNGVGVIDASSLSPDHQVATDPQEAERIEVLRGPSALAYGGSAIGGVVNILDERIASHFEPGLRGRALVSATSIDAGQQASGAVSAGFANHWTLTLDGVERRTDDYDVPKGALATGPDDHTVLNSYSQLNAVGAGLSYVGADGWGGLSIKHTDSNYGSPAEQDVHIELQQTRLDARGGFDWAVGPFEKVHFAGGYANYRHVEFEGPRAGTTFLSKGAEGRLELVQGNHGGWQGAVGLQALTRNFDAIGAEALIPRTRIQEIGAFALQRLDRETWGVEGGLRLDRRSVVNVRADHRFTNLSASLGAFVRPAKDWFVGLSVARASRAPTEEELSALGAHPATGVYEIGDPNLGRETSISAEASLHYGGDPWTLDLHTFYSDYSGFIDLVPTGTTDANSGFPIQLFRADNARFRGAEAEVSYRIWTQGQRSFRLELAGDLVRGTTDAGPGVRIPPWSLTGRGVFEGGWWTGAVELRNVGRQTRVAAFESPTAGYTMLNASLVVRPFAAQPRLQVYLDAHNLTDVIAREHVSFLKDVAPMPGRSFRLGVGYKF